jgi:hypothetical protein
VDPVVLFKLALLGYLYSIRSERQLCEEAGLNLAWRWFLGYELSEPIPDHSVLTKARQRFGPAGYGQFFQRVVGLGGERGLIPGRRLYVDSTLVAVNAAAMGGLPPLMVPRGPSGASQDGPPVPDRHSLHSAAVCSRSTSKATPRYPSATASSARLDFT